MKGWAINQILFAISIFASNDHEINRLNNRDFNIDQKKIMIMIFPIIERP